MNNRYQVIGPIASGGRGEVLKAWDSNLGREVAIKRVKREEGQDAEKEIQDLVKEARTLSTLQHPNVVSVFDVGLDDEGAYIVMELVKGETLEDIIAKGAVTAQDFDRLVTQTMEGLIAAHAAGLIHLDLKPQNLMLTWHASGSFQVKILDFGLALAAVQPVQQELDDEGALFGSIYFMAPEQFERSPVDARTDLYSLGCIFYYALTKKYPFTGENGPEVMTAHLYHQLVPLAKLRPDLPAFIHQWVEWLISRVPEDRPASTAQALAAFQRKRLPSSAVAVAVVAEEPEATPVAEVASKRSGVEVVDGKVKRSLEPKGLLGGSKAVASRAGSPGAAPAGARPTPAKRPGSDAASRISRYTLPILTVLVLLSAGWFYIRKNQQNKRMERFAELASDPEIEGSSQDARLLVSFLADPATSPAAGVTLANLKGGETINTVVVEALGKAKATDMYSQVNLLNVAALRGVKGAIPEAFAHLNSDLKPVREAAWNALASLADADQLPTMLERAEGVDGEMDRFAENAVVAVVERAKNRKAAAGEVVNVYRSGMGSDVFRAMLVRMLGRVGGAEAYQQLEKAINSGSAEVRKAAMLSIQQWPDHEPLPKLAERLSAEKDAVGRLLMLQAMAALEGRPGPLSQEQLFEIGKQAVDAAQDRREMDAALAGLSRVDSPQTVAFFEKLGQDDPKRKNLAESLVKKMKDRLSREIDGQQPPVVLPADRAEFERGSFLEIIKGSLSGWQTNNDWAAWLVQLPAGNYTVQVTQSSDAETPGVYEVLLAGAVLPTQTVKTGAEFKDFEIGEVQVKAAGLYRLMVRAQKMNTEFSVMSLKQLTLQKK